MASPACRGGNWIRPCSRARRPRRGCPGPPPPPAPAGQCMGLGTGHEKGLRMGSGRQQAGHGAVAELVSRSQASAWQCQRRCIPCRHEGLWAALTLYCPDAPGFSRLRSQNRQDEPSHAPSQAGLRLGEPLETGSPDSPHCGHPSKLRDRWSIQGCVTQWACVSGHQGVTCMCMSTCLGPGGSRAFGVLLGPACGPSYPSCGSCGIDPPRFLASGRRGRVSVDLCASRRGSLAVNCSS